MQVTFLGTADGHTSARREHSGIFVQLAETTLLLDCGASVARFLLQKKLPPEAPEILWISHMHSDHTAQFSSLIQSLWLRGRKAPLHLYGPEGALKDLKWWLEKSMLFPELIGFPLIWHPTVPGRVEKQDPLLFTPFPTEHLNSFSAHFKSNYPETCFDCHGVLMTYQGKHYIYSADIAHPGDLLPALKQGKIAALFTELTHFPERQLFQELARHQVESVWITHYPDQLILRESELKVWAREEGYQGAVHLMHDRLSNQI